MRDWHDILKTCDLQNWKEALAAVMTYAQPEEFSSLCGQCQNSNAVLAGNAQQPPPPDSTFPPFTDLLGDRLEAADDAELRAQACLCYICAGNVEKLVVCWTSAQDGQCPLSLQVRSHSHPSSLN